MIDITRRLYAGHPNWPGDSPYDLLQTTHMERGDSVNVMRLSTSTHVGTHVDAPYHYDDTGARMGEVPLERFIGDAQVVFALGRTEVGADALPTGDLPERVIFRTGQPERWEGFPEDFAPLTPELVHALADRGVKLVGTDSPSVDAYSSTDLPVHRACAERDVLILEGLNLTQVKEGRYQLICLPLALADADASPVRAVLL